MDARRTPAHVLALASCGRVRRSSGAIGERPSPDGSSMRPIPPKTGAVPAHDRVWMKCVCSIAAPACSHDARQIRSKTFGRSIRVTCGRFTERLSTATCCRSARFSNTSTRRLLNTEPKVARAAMNRVNISQPMLQRRIKKVNHINAIEFSGGTAARCDRTYWMISDGNRCRL